MSTFSLESATKLARAGWAVEDDLPLVLEELMDLLQEFDV